MPREESSAHYERLKRQLQQTILTEYPNPERKGCPGEAVLRGLASRYLDDSVDNDPNWQHVTHCSPCYAEFLALRADMSRPARARRIGLRAGMVVIAATAVGAAWYIAQRPGTSAPERPQIAELVYKPHFVDLEHFSTERSEGSQAPREPIVLGRTPEELTIRLPFASRPGRYEVHLVEGGRPLLSTGGEARVADADIVLTVKVDLSKLAPGKYSLRLQRPPAGWADYPAEIR